MGGEKYAVLHGEASKAATATTTAIEDLGAVKTSITGPLADAEGGLPPEFANAAAQLKRLREDHERDMKKIKSYATSCVGSLNACLTVYETTSAEMVAEQKATEAKVGFDHGTLFGNSEKALNTAANKHTTKPFNDAAIGKDEGQQGGRSYEHTSTSNGSETTTTQTSGKAGLTTSTAHTESTQGDRTSVSDTTTTSVNGWNENLSVKEYTGHGFDTSTGGNETSASGSQTTYEHGVKKTKDPAVGGMDLPVAR